ncbi:hypothetical protein EJD97_005434 [Solanum chilense]|uniref:Uncharacterized protein n=1 Tax=Solanum chilense TaxID=4083 RepID=A0A6N2ALU8_SOLCI|nr:hypothetical protein EJD97_005434 [Solanum chilense]
MEMWPERRNPMVEQPEARQMFAELSKKFKPKSTPTPTHERGRVHYERASTSKTDTSNNNVGTRRGEGNGYKKRPKVVGQGVFVAYTGYTCINGSGMENKQAMTQRELQVQSVMGHIQTRSKAGRIQIRA